MIKTIFIYILFIKISNTANASATPAVEVLKIPLLPNRNPNVVKYVK